MKNENKKKLKFKIRECDHCGKECNVPDSLPDDVAVFCSSKCSYKEAGF